MMGAGVVVMMCVEEVMCDLHCLDIIYVNALFQFHVHYLLFLAMELTIVLWEMMEFLPMETLVVSHVTLVMS